jgi:hypothetical protein
VSANIERLVALVRRDLGAVDVRVVAKDEAPAQDDPLSLRRPMSGDRILIATFAEPPTDVDARTRRLDMMIDSFRDVTIEPVLAPSRPPPASSLHEELRGLAERAGAIDALVIDARSPIVWGAADADRVSKPEDTQPPAEVVRLDDHRAGIERPSGERASRSERPPPVTSDTMEVEAPSTPTDRALDAVRALPVLSSLHKGGHLHHAERGDDFGFVARSFAGIYVLIVVFRTAHDELRAERAVQQSLPIIERLVLALPPLDPTPMAGAMAMRRVRRR